MLLRPTGMVAPFGLRLENWPAMMTLPSAWVATANTLPSTFGSKPSAAEGVCAKSAVVVAEIRAQQVRKRRASDRGSEAWNMIRWTSKGRRKERSRARSSEVGLRRGAWQEGSRGRTEVFQHWGIGAR